MVKMTVLLQNERRVKKRVKPPIHFKKLLRLAELDCGKIRSRSRFLRSNPIVQGYHEIINQPVYDDGSVAVNTAFPTQTLFFQVPAGQSGKTLWDTSMRLNGILQAPQKFLIRAFRFIVRNDATIADLTNLLYNTFFRFVINQKEYFFGPTVLWSAGAGVVAAFSQLGTAPAGTSAFGYSSNGWPDQRSIFSLSRPIQLEQNENFFLELNVGSAFNTNTNATNPVGTGLRYYALLDGELSRAVM